MMDKLQELIQTTGNEVAYKGNFESKELKELFEVLKSKNYEWIVGKVIDVKKSVDEVIRKQLMDKTTLLIDEDKKLSFGSLNYGIGLDANGIISLLKDNGLTHEEQGVLLALETIKTYCEKNDVCEKCVLKYDENCLFTKNPCALKLTTKTIVKINL